MTLDDIIIKLRKFYVIQRRLPSYSELGLLLDLKSKKNSYRWAEKLIEAGYLGKDEKGKLFPVGLFKIPKLGFIHAGYPTPGHALHDDSIDLYKYLLDTPGSVFSLVVKGDSMIDEGINDGDVVLVQKSREPRNRDIVAAFVDGEWTLKQYVIMDGEIVLAPANPKYPLIRPKHSLQMGGVVISVLRNYY